MNDGDFEGAYRKPVYFRSPFLEFKDTILNEVGLDLANPMPSPRVIKTHLPVHFMPKQVKEKNCKVIQATDLVCSLKTATRDVHLGASLSALLSSCSPEHLEVFALSNSKF